MSRAKLARVSGLALEESARAIASSTINAGVESLMGLYSNSSASNSPVKSLARIRSSLTSACDRGGVGCGCHTAF